jgi:hypothetical protein
MIHQWSIDSSQINTVIKVKDDFLHSSENNQQWMSVQDLQHWIGSIKHKLGQI